MKDKYNMNDELSSSMTGGRFKRYAKVTSAMGGLAARLAGEKYLGIKIDREQHAADLRAALGGLKGPLMKVAQILATIPDALPKEYVNELSHLQADAPSMGWLFVKRRMKSELGWRYQLLRSLRSMNALSKNNGSPARVLSLLLVRRRGRGYFRAVATTEHRNATAYFL